ncbi:Tad domain-containing protein [Actibacterium sp. D379-3]
MLVFGMLILILMLWSGGIAIDAMRYEAARTELQSTLDRAVLAAADLDQTADATAVVEDYFEKAGLADALGDVHVDSTSASGQLSFRRVSATASTDLDSIFTATILPPLLNTMLTSAASTAEEGITDLEISLVVDVSGSMGWNSSTGWPKITELREAAKDFVYYMQCNPNASRTSGTPCSVEYGAVSVSLVPYSEQVTAGEDLLDVLNITDEHLYSHCVTFEEGDFLTPGFSLNPDVYLLRTGHFDPWNSGTYASDGSRTCRLDSWRRIRPFMDNYQELMSRIDGLGAGGNTSIDVGMKWGAALLDPDTRSAITALTSRADGVGSTVVDPVFSDRPYDYTQEYSMKVIVLMTDGVNTDQHYLKEDYRTGESPIWRNTSQPDRYSIYNEDTNKYYYTYDGSWNDYPYGDADGEEVTVTNTTCRWTWWYGYQCWTTTNTSVVEQPCCAVQMTFPEVWNKFTTYWYSQWSWLGNPESSWGNSTKNARLQDICSAAKNQGVIVYTIGFEVSGDAHQVMSNCASTPGHYFAANGANLAETFGVIASSINQLRLTQ